MSYYKQVEALQSLILDSSFATGTIATRSVGSHELCIIVLNPVDLLAEAVVETELLIHANVSLGDENCAEGTSCEANLRRTIGEALVSVIREPH